MRAVAHIGMPKTGSSTIQGFLAEHGAHLRAHGLHYANYSPRQDQAEFLLATHQRLGRPIRNPAMRHALGAGTPEKQAARVAEFERALDADLARLAPGTRYLVSCEMIGWPYRREGFMRTFHEWMTQRFDEVDYVIYLRPQDSWMLSEYSQLLRNGGTKSMEEFLRTVTPPDYHALIRRWEGIAGTDRVDVRLLDPARLKAGDLVADFCDALAIPAPEGTGAARRNEKLSAVAAARTLRINRALRRVQGSRAGHAVAEGLRRLSASAAARSAPPLSFRPEQSARIREVTARSNDRLRAARFPELDCLFPTMRPAP
ncbi:hypothetical protein OG2516_08132 [Oceanicola granulosus HTCC2516]|uniref:Sulfotransferase family protein n=1 Tax=Oceanicola granulosus (strain ATCC BAA-861 / DSM 15982 / KCTC 12143 / HTCC2516) TaxID=314256 RepID=Q2CI28_OCEGH|nr:hypothetical protein [Oceanicola granulosus]EAR52430.1 hypothetical protein OG2516_08132 [Oceanicola granulosus HTCC2516]